MVGLEIKIKFKINLTKTPLYMEIIVFFCNPNDCKIEVEIVNIAVKNTPIDRIDKSGAALATETGFLKSKDNIGPDNTAIPIAQGIEMIDANFRHECIVFMALARLEIRSSSVEAFRMEAKEAVRFGVKEEAIG